MEDLRPKEGRRLWSFDWSPELVPGRDLLLLAVALPLDAEACVFGSVLSGLDDVLPQMLVEKKGIVPWTAAELAERCMARGALKIPCLRRSRGDVV